MTGMKAFIGEADRSWMDAAACGNHEDPDLWYPDTGNVYAARVIQAGLICASCPVRDECTVYGMHERSGIYGGYLKANGRSIRIPVTGQHAFNASRAQQQQPKRTAKRVPTAKTAEPSPGPVETVETLHAPIQASIKDQNEEGRVPQPPAEPAAAQAVEPVPAATVQEAAPEPVQRPAEESSGTTGQRPGPGIISGILRLVTRIVR